MNIIIDYVLNGFNESISISYFFVLLFTAEIIKSFTLYNSISKKHVFKFDKKKKFQFKAKWMVVILGLLIGTIFIIGDLVSNDSEIKISHTILKIFLTYAVTTTFYELLFEIFINKAKKILIAITRAEIKPVVIDINNGFNEEGDVHDEHHERSAIEQNKKDVDNWQEYNTIKNEVINDVSSECDSTK
jgi:hypothetical protein